MMRTKVEQVDRDVQSAATGRTARADATQRAGFDDGRTESAIQRRQCGLANTSRRVEQHRTVASAIQRKADADTPQNRTGLPDTLKAGIESLSGISMDGVKVHYNSPRPAQLQAHAYAQGTDIHLAPGQERHLAHEAWHVVQQAQGRVAATMKINGDVSGNDDAGLESEADAMGAKALGVSASGTSIQRGAQAGSSGVQQYYANRIVANGARHHYTDGWGEQYGITSDAELIASVDKSVRGSGWIDLGWFDAPEEEQVEGDRRFQKQCWIKYVNANQPETTLITHCGPSGKKEYYD